MLPSDLVAFLEEGREPCATASSGVLDLVLEEGTLWVESEGVDDLEGIVAFALLADSLVVGTDHFEAGMKRKLCTDEERLDTVIRRYDFVVRCESRT